MIGIAGRYHFDRQVAKVSADEFAAFDEPGSLKAVAEVTLAPEGYGTRLRCDLRVRATDDDTRSTLSTAWLVAGPALGSSCRGSSTRCGRRPRAQARRALSRATPTATTAMPAICTRVSRSPKKT